MGSEEVWIPIPNYENKYLISNFGKVKSLKRNINLKPDITKDGYFAVRLHGDEKSEHRLLHRLLAECFIPLPDLDGTYEIDHIDNNRQNNELSNLRWVTHDENLNKSFELKHQRKNKRKVYQYDLNGNLLAEYESVNEAFRKTHIRHISECCRGVIYYKTAGGFYWKYEKLNKEDVINGLG